MYYSVKLEPSHYIQYKSVEIKEINHGVTGIPMQSRLCWILNELENMVGYGLTHSTLDKISVNRSSVIRKKILSRTTLVMHLMSTVLYNPWHGLFLLPGHLGGFIERCS